MQVTKVQVGFPGGKKVAAKVGDHIVLTDQPHARGGGDEAPSPYGLFLASIGACVGYYALVFCQSRDISCEGMAVWGEFRSEHGTLADAELHIRPPEGFPEKYRDALLRSVDRCSVKRSILADPEIRVHLEWTAEETGYHA